MVLRLIWDNWHDAFSGTLGRSDRSLVSELRDHRNKWAHQEPFSSDDAYRALDSVQRLLTSISAPQVREIDAHKQELLRVRFPEPVRGERRRTGRTVAAAGAVDGLKAWLDVATPHQAVASGRYQHDDRDHPQTSTASTARSADRLSIAPKFHGPERLAT